MNLQDLYKNIYEPYNFDLVDKKKESENNAYDAHTFALNGKKIVYRQAKITPTKTGLFVALWQRSSTKTAIPYSIHSDFDLVIIHCYEHGKTGQFIFNKKALEQKKIISTNKQTGKNGFRVYPSWSIPKNKQAEQTQKWQLNHFVETTQLSENIIEQIKKLLK